MSRTERFRGVARRLLVVGAIAVSGTATAEPEVVPSPAPTISRAHLDQLRTLRTSGMVLSYGIPAPFVISAYILIAEPPNPEAVVMAGIPAPMTHTPGSGSFSLERRARVAAVGFYRSPSIAWE